MDRSKEDLLTMVASIPEPYLLDTLVKAFDDYRMSIMTSKNVIETRRNMLATFVPLFIKDIADRENKTIAEAIQDFKQEISFLDLGKKVVKSN